MKDSTYVKKEKMGRGIRLAETPEGLTGINLLKASRSYGELLHFTSMLRWAKLIND
jgi:hypothetical protein